MFLRYIFSGCIALIAHLSLMSILIEIFLITPLLSSNIGFVFAIFVNFYLQYFFTFKSNEDIHKSFLKYFMFCLLGLFLNSLFFTFLNVFINKYLVSQTVTTFLIFVLNYFLNKFLIFKA